jgi:hypothetical protein
MSTFYKLRIDFDSLKSGNGVIFRNDSTYVISNHKLVRSVRNENELIFFLGGLYFVPFDDHILQIEKYHDVVAGGPVDKTIFEPGISGK